MYKNAKFQLKIVIKVLGKGQAGMEKPWRGVCGGVVENFSDKQDGALGTKCAMESQFPTQTAASALVVVKYEKLSEVYFKFIYSFTTLLNDPPIQHSRPKMEKNPRG